MLIKTSNSESGHFSSSAPRAGVEAFFQKIALFGAEFFQRAGPDVMVRHHQSVGRDERARAPAVDPHGSMLQVRKPAVGRVEAVAILSAAFFGGTI